MRQALTFDDVLLVPQKSNILPNDVSLETRLTPEIKLDIPLISANMDTVTEAPMAIAMAREGGLGIIHKNLTPAQQALEVASVKRAESGIIANPITLPPHKTVSDAIKVMKKYEISGIPIVENKKLVGILTLRDLRFETNLGKSVSSIMTKELITAPEGTTIKKAKVILHKNRIEKLPLVDKDGNLKALITIKDIQKIIDYPKATKDKSGRLRVGASIGVGKEALTRTKLLLEAGVDIVVIGPAHGHSKGVLETIRAVKQKYPELPIIAGNVATAQGTRDLIKAGANSVKVGMGPGSICTTRVITGVGLPQLTAIQDCAQEIKRHKTITLVADGGTRYSGDITKALAGGAQVVMAGKLFAGTDEAPGKLIYFEGKAYKSFRGMGSFSALKKGSRDRYGLEKRAVLVPQGVEGRVDYKGPLHKVIEQLVGGITAGMGMVGAKNIPELQKKAEFILTSSASVTEGHPHGITITDETLNYPGRI